ncbi:MAG: archaemetzincin family Zn-dependent metalloprotease [Deltaproteobacteria bacterium]|nr:archaemetzincin family Zn-dependent metalloprotease [Deltaproteobacteria bacterium]
MNVPPEHIIVISPIGDLEDTSLLNQISREINRIFTHPTEIVPLLKDVNFALDPVRNQYHSTVILEKLERLSSVNTMKVLGITMVDLFIPILTHVYGEAQLGGKACIVSTHRLKEDLSLTGSRHIYYNRITKEAIHELGHTFNLRHCPDHFCIMHYCRTVKDVDGKSDQLCRYCKTLLEDEMKRPAKK